MSCHPLQVHAVLFVSAGAGYFARAGQAQSAVFLQGHSAFDTVCGVDVRWIDLLGAAEMRNGLAELSATGQKRAEVDAGRVKLWVEFHRPPEADHGLVYRAAIGRDPRID